MKKYNEYQKIIALLLSAIIMLEFHGCYSIRAVSKNEIQYSPIKCCFIHDPKTDYIINNLKISEGTLSEHLSNNTIDIKKKQQAHIYVAPDSAIKKSGEITSFPFENIAKVEVYKIDGGKTTLAVAGAAEGTLVITSLIVLLTKGVSCPFIYCDDGNNMNFEGEIYSGATALPLERHDYLKLKSVKPVNDSYRIMLSNEVDEIQNTNLAELVVIDHPVYTDLQMDKYGNPHSLADISRPVSAYDSYGRSLINELSCFDSLRYISQMKKDPLLKDTISLSFEKPDGATDSKLVISGKNTMWLDYIFGKFTDLFGSRYDNWKKQTNNKTREELQRWMFDQGMPMVVYLETGTGLKFVDYFNIPGPMADRQDVMKIDLSDVPGKTVNLKLVSGLLFWDLDFAGMDFSKDEVVKKTVIPISSATDENQKDVTSLLLADDNRYLVQPDGNNHTLITFPAVASAQGLNRSFFLHTKGNYEILREAKGKPDIAYARNFSEPGYFIKFSKDHILKYYLKSN